MFLFLLPVLVFARPPCPKVTCQPLDLGQCASLDSEGFTVNSNPQDADLKCFLFDIFKAYWDNSHDPRIEARDTSGASHDPAIGIQCPDRDFPVPDFEGATGEFAMSKPKRCTTKLECKQINGQYANCVCGLDGNFYCLPNPSSSAFEYFWRDCKKNKEFDGYYAHFEVWRSWQYAHDYYVMNLTAPSCASQLEELKYMQPSTAQWVGLAAMIAVNL